MADQIGPERGVDVDARRDARIHLLLDQRGVEMPRVEGHEADRRRHRLRSLQREHRVRREARRSPQSRLRRRGSSSSVLWHGESLGQKGSSAEAQKRRSAEAQERRGAGAQGRRRAEGPRAGEPDPPAETVYALAGFGMSGNERLISGAAAGSGPGSARVRVASAAPGVTSGGPGVTSAAAGAARCATVERSDVRFLSVLNQNGAPRLRNRMETRMPKKWDAG